MAAVPELLIRPEIVAVLALTAIVRAAPFRLMALRKSRVLVAFVPLSVRLVGAKLPGPHVSPVGDAVPPSATTMLPPRALNPPAPAVIWMVPAPVVPRLRVILAPVSQVPAPMARFPPLASPTPSSARMITPPLIRVLPEYVLVFARV